MIKLKPLTADLYQRYEGSPPPVTMRGYAFVDGDDVLGIVAVWNRCVMFEIRDRLKSHKRAIVKAWPVFKTLLSNGTFFAIRDTSEPTSHGLLTHFGFEPLHDDIYIYRGS